MKHRFENGTLLTNEPASCRYDTVEGRLYKEMIGTFTSDVAGFLC